MPPSYIIPLSTVLTTCLNHTCPDIPGVLILFYFEKAQSTQYQVIGNFSNEKLCSSHLSSSFFFPPLMGCSRHTGHCISFFPFIFPYDRIHSYGSAGSLNAEDPQKRNSSLDLSSDLQPPLLSSYLNLHLNIKCPSHT